jgi:hypothetical protein
MTGTDIEKASEGEPAAPAEVPEDAAVEVAVLEPSADPHAEAVRTRVLLPLLLPLVSAGAVFVYVINLSRALIAGGKWGSLVIASIITLSILAGAAWISAHPRLRTSTLAMLTAALFVLVVASGLTSVGPSEEKEKAGGGGYRPPAGPPVGTLEVDANPNLTFQSTAFTVPAGIILVNYVDKSPAHHTLAFDEKEFTGFLLSVPDGKNSEKVELAAGQTYTIFCTVPGHRAAGMEATVTAQ